MSDIPDTEVDPIEAFAQFKKGEREAYVLYPETQTRIVLRDGKFHCLVGDDETIDTVEGEAIDDFISLILKHYEDEDEEDAPTDPVASSEEGS